MPPSSYLSKYAFTETLIRITSPIKAANDTSPNVERRHQGDLRMAFWSSFDQANAAEDSVGRADRLEASIRTYFADCLRSKFQTLVSNADGQISGQSAAAIVVRTRILEYSSMDIGMALEPIQKVVDLFEGNFPYFQAFLGTYIPIAFAEAINQNAFYPDEWGQIVGQHNFEVEVAASLRAAFDNRKRPTRLASTFNKANWLWILSNTSLVLPVLLASLFFWKLWDSVNERDAQLDHGYRNLVRLQMQEIKMLRKNPNPPNPPSSATNQPPR